MRVGAFVGCLDVSEGCVVELDNVVGFLKYFWICCFGWLDVVIMKVNVNVNDNVLLVFVVGVVDFVINTGASTTSASTATSIGQCIKINAASQIDLISK